MALLPATLHKVLGEGDSNTLLNERRWWSGAHVPAARVLLILAVHLVGGFIWGTSCDVRLFV